MSSKQPAQTTQVQKVELPAWVDKASQENYQLATQVANRPLEQYTGQTVAGVAPATQSAYDYLAKMVGSTDPLYAKATGMLDKASAFQDRASPLYDDAKALYDKTLPLYDKAAGFQDKAGAAYDATMPLYDKATGAFKRAGDIYEGTMPLYNQAVGWADRAGGVQNEAADIFRSTAGPLDIKSFLNPYTAEVEANAIRNANEGLTRNLLNVTNTARKAGAFGGSRHGIESGVTRAEGIKGIGDLSAQLRKAGIDFATNTAIADRAGRQAAGTGLLNTGAGYLNTGRGVLDAAAGMRDTAAGIGNTGAGFLSTAAGLRDTGTGYLNTATGTLNTAGGLRDTAAGNLSTARGLLDASTAAGNVANQYGTTAGQMKTSQMADLGALLGAGESQRGQTQAELDAAAKQFYERRDYPVEQLNMRLAALGMSPYGKTSTTQTTGKSESAGTDWATLGLGVLKTLPALLAFSDRRLKTDIEKVGEESGLPMYAYRYKGDPKTYPKVVGPMAQDVEKKYPKAVKKIGGYRAIDIGNLMEALA